jgi:hypothetical protein
VTGYAPLTDPRCTPTGPICRSRRTHASIWLVAKRVLQAPCYKGGMRRGSAPKWHKHQKARRTTEKMVLMRMHGWTNLINMADIINKYNMRSHDGHKQGKRYKMCNRYRALPLRIGHYETQSFACMLGCAQKSGCYLALTRACAAKCPRLANK